MTEYDKVISDRIISEYKDLINLLENPESKLWSLLNDMKTETFNKVGDSVEDATYAHYKIKAIKELEGKFRSFGTRYQIELSKLEQATSE